MTFRWSSDHLRWNVCPKYVSQKYRKSLAARALRTESALEGRSPMSRPESESIALRSRARSFIAS